MSFQTRFSSLNNELNYPSPVQTSSGPSLWLRRMVILKHFSLDEENVIRDIKLRPGLNILWAKPSKMHEDDSLFSDGLSGHTAGKTTFIRFVRYIMGDSTFGNEDQMIRIRRAFPDAWVIGDVVIKDENWIICRPLKNQLIDTYVYKNTELDKIFSTKEDSAQTFSQYLEAIQNTTVNRLNVRTLPVSKKEISWHHLLAWLSRDQEARLDDLLAWRDPKSESPSLQLDVADRAALVRSVLGLMDLTEQQLSIHQQGLLRARNEAKVSLSKLSYHALQTRANLERNLRQPLPPPGEMFLATTRQLILDAKQKKLASLQIPTPPSQEALAELEKQWEEYIYKKNAAQRQCDETGRQLGDAKKLLELEDGNVTEEKRREILGQLPPGRHYCSVPLHQARANNCPLASNHISDLTDRRAANHEAEALLVLKRQVDLLSDKLKLQERELREIERQTKDSHQALIKARTDVLSHASYTVITNESENLLSLAQQAFSAWEAVRGCETKIEDLSAAIGTARERLVAIRELQLNNLRRFKRYFNHIVQALLGRDVEAEVKIDGKGIHSRIERHGDCSSVAINTVKVIAFDLAALCAHVEGFGSFPGLLIHDGPREADLAAGLYRRIFDYMKQLEASCEKQNNVNFQYIITTTEPPPEGLQCDPWLICPVLDASKAETRLLRVDL